MTDKPAALDRPLTDAERELLAELTAWGIATQTGVSTQTAAAVLATLAERSELHITYDAHNVYVTRQHDGRVLTHCTREWLAFFAAHPDEPIDMDKYVTWFKSSTDDEDGAE